MQSGYQLKTVITPSPSTIKAFRAKKAELLKRFDYKKVAEKGQSGTLSEEDYRKVESSFMSKRMYLAMVSSCDFAESFISAEWSYDIWQNAMGELELTGIIAGYLKSVEQLLFIIAKFHQDEGLYIKGKSRNGRIEFTSDNESQIDSTLGSLNDFVTSKKAKLAISANIRGCIYRAIDTWRKYQRNGYFHKHNLYQVDNKIDDVRELTIYLYYLILGGIQFSSEQIAQLGIVDNESYEVDFSFEREYQRFDKWFDAAIDYDLPESIPGLWLLLLHDDDKNEWSISPYLMKYFYMDDFAGSNKLEFNEMIHMSHVKDIPSFKWTSSNTNRIDATLFVQDMFAQYFKDHLSARNRVQAVIIGLDKELQLVYYRDSAAYFESDTID